MSLLRQVTLLSCSYELSGLRNMFKANSQPSKTKKSTPRPHAANPRRTSSTNPWKPNSDADLPVPVLPNYHVGPQELRLRPASLRLPIISANLCKTMMTAKPKRPFDDPKRNPPVVGPSRIPQSRRCQGCRHRRTHICKLPPTAAHVKLMRLEGLQVVASYHPNSATNEPPDRSLSSPGAQAYAIAHA